MSSSTFAILLILLMIFSAALPVSQGRIGPSFELGQYDVMNRVHPRGGILAAVAKTTSLLTPAQGFESYYYDQTLDHFSFTPASYSTFKQRYFINRHHWGGAQIMGPIFVKLGGENAMEYPSGFIADHAPKLGALQLYIEHRFYGGSVPFGTQEEALKNATLRGYLNSEQALADYAEVIMHVKESLQAERSPVIVFGGSYAGMLASWFRLKYPHVGHGALASSAPILLFHDITSSDRFLGAVSKDFKETSLSCYQTIKDSWAEIDRLASQKDDDGLSILSNKFKSCTPLTLDGVEALKWKLLTMYRTSAKYDRQYPNIGLEVVCNAIDDHSHSTGRDILDRIFAAVVASSEQSSEWYDYNGDVEYTLFSNETFSGWDWQTCSEMVSPIGVPRNDDNDDDIMFPEHLIDMFPKYLTDMKEYINHCMDTYGVAPRPRWATSHYGGHDIKAVLRRFGSNIIFSNGLIDPFSIGGVLEDISASVVALTSKKGSHCMDLNGGSEDDPDWLIKMRNKEVEIINGWIHQYYRDLLVPYSSSTDNNHPLKNKISFLLTLITLCIAFVI